MANAKTDTITLGTIQNLLLTDIDVDMKWNGRSGDWAADSGASDATNDFKELKKSIELNGQLTPLLVRYNPKTKKHFLVAGFRRFEALRQLANGNLKATAKCDVSEMTDIQARKLNLIENTERQNLKPADLCWTVGQYSKSAKEAGIKIGQVELAGIVGTSQPYVNYMLKIVEKLPPKMFEEWRKSVKDIPYKTVQRIAEMEDKQEQAAAWKALIETPVAPEGGAGAKKGKVERLCDKARDMGRRLGALQRAELADFGNMIFNVVPLEILIDLPRSNSDPSKLAIEQADVDLIAQAMKEGFSFGQRAADKAAE